MPKQVVPIADHEEPFLENSWNGHDVGETWQPEKSPRIFGQIYSHNFCLLFPHLFPNLSQTYQSQTSKLHQSIHPSIMPSHRILTCSRNNRINIIRHLDDEPTMQTTTKPKQLSLKSMMETQEKLSVVSENAFEWPSLNKEQPTPSLQSETEEPRQQAPIFRQHIDLDDIEDMLVIKRANPIYDSDDEDEDLLRSSPKRQKTDAPSQLFWNEQLSEDESEGFTLSPSFLRSH
jgi:hypothetical protein